MEALDGLLGKGSPFANALIDALASVADSGFARVMTRVGDALTLETKGQQSSRHVTGGTVNFEFNDPKQDSTNAGLRIEILDTGSTPTLSGEHANEAALSLWERAG